MGMRFRKSINLGGARINLSKSGIGFSLGTKGARITKKTNGGKRTTLSVPGTGLSFVKEKGTKKRKRAGSGVPKKSGKRQVRKFCPNCGAVVKNKKYCKECGINFIDNSNVFPENAQQSTNGGSTALKVFKWIVSVFFAIMSLAALSATSIVSALIFLGGAVFANPLFTKFLGSKGVVIKKYISIPALIATLVIGTFAISGAGKGGETTEPSYSENTQTVVDEEKEVSEEITQPSSVVEDKDLGASGEKTDINSELKDESTSVLSTDESDLQSESLPSENELWKAVDKSLLDNIPEYNGEPFAEVNGNKPFFSDSQLAVEGVEIYGDLDELGRCTQAVALIDKSMMPTEKRGPIGHIRPSGWETIKYAEVIENLYLYNRCHLIAYQLTGQNDNVNNLITGTDYLNRVGMLPFEDQVVGYLKETDKHVLYRSTPIFEGDNLVASGVLMEAESVEDKGEGLSFCVYCYNVQPDIEIDYATGKSCLSKEYLAKKEEQSKKEQIEAPQVEEQQKKEEPVTETAVAESVAPALGAIVAADALTQAAGGGTGKGSNFDTYDNLAQQQTNALWVLNTNSMKIHHPNCKSVKKIAPHNYATSNQSLEELISAGYTTCGNCF